MYVYEAILANPELACNLAAGAILADQGGLLAPLTREVAAGYAHPRWVAARCAHKREVATQALIGAQHAATPGDAFWPLAVVFLSSAYCGYVHTYAHDPAWCVVTAGTAEAVAPAPRALSRATAAVRRRRGGALRARLAAWMGRQEQPPC